MRARPRDVGDQPDVAAGRDVVEPIEVAELRNEPVDAVGDGGPEGILIARGNIAKKCETPGLHIHAGESQALERDGHAHRISVLGDPPFRFPVGIELPVVALPFGVETVQLNAVGIDEELEGVLAVVKGVEQHADKIVREDIVALGVARAQFAGGGLAHEDHVQILGVVGQPGFGFAGGWFAVVGIALDEIGDGHRAVGRSAVDVIVQDGRSRNPLDVQVPRGLDGRCSLSAGARGDAQHQ